MAIAPPHEKLKIDIKAENPSKTDPDKVSQMTKQEVDILKHKLEHLTEWKVEEVCKYLNNKRIKPLLQR